jgi:hypothetical protein
MYVGHHEMFLFVPDFNQKWNLYVFIIVSIIIFYENGSRERLVVSCELTDG